MVEQNCWDDIPMGPIVHEDFESLLNSLDFPLESLEEDGLGRDWDPSLYQLLGPIPADALPPVSRGDNANGCLNAANELPEAQGTVPFQAHSPISVLEHNSSCSGGQSTFSNFGTKGRRSKRARPSTLNPWILMAPTSCTAFASKKNSDAKKGKEKKRRKLSQQSSVMESSLFKKCTHCEVKKTPQWREGPLGPKTLCNACGVRYRSGRLLPEYRPAASPTFVPSLHSNSHRKVIEMRRNAVVESQGDLLETKRSFTKPSNATEPKICSSEYLFV